AARSGGETPGRPGRRDGCHLAVGITSDIHREQRGASARCPDLRCPRSEAARLQDLGDAPRRTSGLSAPREPLEQLAVRPRTATGTLRVHPTTTTLRPHLMAEYLRSADPDSPLNRHPIRWVDA